MFVHFFCDEKGRLLLQSPDDPSKSVIRKRQRSCLECYQHPWVRLRLYENLIQTTSLTKYIQACSFQNCGHCHQGQNSPRSPECCDPSIGEVVSCIFCLLIFHSPLFGSQACVPQLRTLIPKSYKSTSGTKDVYFRGCGHWSIDKPVLPAWR